MKILLALLLMTNCVANSQDVRKATWGMSKASVKATETASPYPDLNSANQLAFKGVIDGYKFLIVYDFNADKLYRCTLVYNEDHASDITYYERFKSISERLDGKYSNFSNETRWKNSLYKSDPERYGFACSLGHVVFHHVWEMPYTKISLIMSGDNFKVSLGIVYRDASYQPSKDTEF